MSYDAAGDKASPIELLILGYMRYLGHGWTFDGLPESTGIHEEMHGQCFHECIHWGSTSLYDKWVKYPAIFEECRTHMHEMSLAGLHGAFSSKDATRSGMERCYYRMENHRRGGTLNMPAVHFWYRVVLAKSTDVCASFILVWISSISRRIASPFSSKISTLS
jgi:hypothetical protein